MATTVSYSASMRTRKTNSASNAKSAAASQEYYENTYNYVGIVHFASMALSGKVIAGITLRIVAAQAGYGTGHTKTVYVRKSKNTILRVAAYVRVSTDNDEQLTSYELQKPDNQPGRGGNGQGDFLSLSEWLFVQGNRRTSDRL